MARALSAYDPVRSKATTLFCVGLEKICAVNRRSEGAFHGRRNNLPLFPKRYFGGCSPAELTQSSRWAAVSACRAFLRSASRSGPGERPEASLRLPSAHLVSRSWRVTLFSPRRVTPRSPRLRSRSCGDAAIPAYAIHVGKKRQSSSRRNPPSVKQGYSRSGQRNSAKPTWFLFPGGIFLFP